MVDSSASWVDKSMFAITITLMLTSLVMISIYIYQAKGVTAPAKHKDDCHQWALTDDFSGNGCYNWRKPAFYWMDGQCTKGEWNSDLKCKRTDRTKEWEKCYTDALIVFNAAVVLIIVFSVKSFIYAYNT